VLLVFPHLNSWRSASLPIRFINKTWMSKIFRIYTNYFYTCVSFLYAVIVKVYTSFGQIHQYSYFMKFTLFVNQFILFFNECLLYNTLYAANFLISLISTFLTKKLFFWKISNFADSYWFLFSNKLTITLSRAL